MAKMKNVLMFLGLTVFFALLTIIMFAQYLNEYDIFSFHKEEVTVTEKVSEHSMFRPPSYHVMIDRPDGEESEERYRVPKWKFTKLEEGDSIDLLTTYGNTYYTVSDILYDSFFFLFAIVLFGGFTLLGLIGMAFEFPEIDKFVDGMKKRRKKTKKKGSGLKVLYGALIIFAFFALRYLWNLFHKLNPFMKGKAEARIVDDYKDVTYRKYEDSEYSLTLQFHDEDGNEIETVKEVTSHVYDAHGIGDTIAISYRKLNPYDAFIQTTNIADVFGTIFYLEFFIYIMFIVLIIVSLRAIPKWKKKQQDNEG